MTNLRELLGQVVPALIDVGEDVDIIEGDIVNSMDIILIVDTLEREYDIMISPEEIDEKNFRSITCIRSFLGSKCDNVT